MQKENCVYDEGVSENQVSAYKPAYNTTLVLHKLPLFFSNFIRLILREFRHLKPEKIMWKNVNVQVSKIYIPDKHKYIK
jgi:hypothetical protein